MSPGKPGAKPGTPRKQPMEQCDLLDAIAHARDIHVDAMEQVSIGYHAPRIYQVVLSCTKELTMLDVQRILAAGQASIAKEDSAEWPG